MVLWETQTAKWTWASLKNKRIQSLYSKYHFNISRKKSLNYQVSGLIKMGSLQILRNSLPTKNKKGLYNYQIEAWARNLKLLNSLKKKRFKRLQEGKSFYMELKTSRSYSVLWLFCNLLYYRRELFLGFTWSRY